MRQSPIFALMEARARRVCWFSKSPSAIGTARGLLRVSTV
jgi:hypothetical protein